MFEGRLLPVNPRLVSRLDRSLEAGGECRCLACLNALQDDLVTLNDVIESHVPYGCMADQLVG